MAEETLEARQSPKQNLAESRPVRRPEFTGMTKERNSVFSPRLPKFVAEPGIGAGFFVWGSFVECEFRLPPDPPDNE